MRWHTGSDPDVLAVTQRVVDQLTYVFVRKAVEHLGAAAARAHEMCHAQLRQVLRYRTRALADCPSKVPDRQLTGAECDEQPHSRRVSKHPEDLDRKIHLVELRRIGRRCGGIAIICTHTCTVADATDERQRTRC